MAFNDPTAKNIISLSPRTSALAFQFINALRLAGIPAYISSGRRTLAQQKALVSEGRSRTLNSKHLTGQAFDLDILGFGRDELGSDFWLALGEYWESMGGTWGGRFVGFYDGGHFQI